MYKLGILGCGNMGKAYISSLIKNNIFTPDEILICNRTTAKNETIQNEFGVHTTTNPQDLENTEIIILGIKPQGLADLKFNPTENTLIISLLVGTTVETLQKKFPNTHIVRFMPNIGQYFGLGMTGIYSRDIKKQLASPFFKGRKKEGFSSEKNPSTVLPLAKEEGVHFHLINTIASAGAQAIWLDNEDDMNHLAAISGSGPAYFFAFADALKKSAQSLGFDEKTSQNLALQTFLGAAEYLKNQTKNISSLRPTTDHQTTSPFQTAITTVASKGGTTQEALKTFTEKNLASVMEAGVKAAVKRGEALAAQTQ